MARHLECAGVVKSYVGSVVPWVARVIYPMPHISWYVHGHR